MKPISVEFRWKSAQVASKLSILGGVNIILVLYSYYIRVNMNKFSELFEELFSKSYSGGGYCIVKVARIGEFETVF